MPQQTTETKRDRTSSAIVTCRVCGCSEHDACVDVAGNTCAWVGRQALCTVCRDAAVAIANWIAAAHEANFRPLMVEVGRICDKSIEQLERELGIPGKAGHA